MVSMGHSNHWLSAMDFYWNLDKLMGMNKVGRAKAKEKNMAIGEVRGLDYYVGSKPSPPILFLQWKDGAVMLDNSTPEKVDALVKLLNQFGHEVKPKYSPTSNIGRVARSSNVTATWVKKENWFDGYNTTHWVSFEDWVLEITGVKKEQKKTISVGDYKISIEKDSIEEVGGIFKINSTEVDRLIELQEFALTKGVKLETKVIGYDVSIGSMGGIDIGCQSIPLALVEKIKKEWRVR